MTDKLETIQYLTFTMADELIVVDGNRVLEILELASGAHESQLPEFMKGVLNLQGCPVPIIDLRLRFAIQEPIQAVNIFHVAVELAKDRENVVLRPSNDTRKVVEMKPSQMEAAPYWLRCSFSKKDLDALSQIFISAATTELPPKECTPGFL